MAGKAVVTGTPDTFKKAGKLLRPAGLAAVHFQTIEIRPVKFELKEKDYDWVIFTSRHGAGFFIKNTGRDFFSGKKIAVVGPETRKAAAGFGLKADFMPAAFDSRAFAAGFGKIISGGAPRRRPGRAAKILLVSPAKGGGALKTALERAGAAVDRVPVYETVPKRKTRAGIKKFLDGGPYSFIVFSSPSTFSGFIKILGKAAARGILSRTRAAAIGRITAGALKKAGVRPVIVPEMQTMAGVVRALAACNKMPEQKA